MNENHITREQLEKDIVQQVRNEVQEVLLLHAPPTWPDDRLDDIEKQVLDHTRLVLDALSANELQSAGALQNHIFQAIAETKRVIRMGGAGKQS
jgi:hypothetical protein